MAIIPVPTLSTAGWVKSVSEKIDFLLAHYFCSDKFQTSLYGTNVSNFQWLLQENADNVATFSGALRQELITYLSRYYDSVTVDTQVQDENPLKPGTKVSVILSIYFKEQGVEYSAQKQVSTLNGRLQSFANLNNLQSTQAS